MERSSKPLVDCTIGQLSRSWLLFHRNRLLQLTFFNELNWLTRPLGTKKNLNKTKTSISFVLNRGQMTLQWLEQGVECVDSIYRWSLPPRRWTRSDRKYHAHGIKKKIEQKDEEKRINIYEKKKKKGELVYSSRWGVATLIKWRGTPQWTRKTRSMPMRRRRGTAPSTCCKKNKKNKKKQ